MSNQSRKRRRRKIRRMKRAAVMLVLGITVCVGIRYLGRQNSDRQQPEDTDIVQASGMTTEAATEEMRASTEEAATEGMETSTEETATEEMETSTEETTTEETETATDKKSFSDAVFVGDSRTEGMVLQTGVKATAYVHKGLTVASVYKDKVIGSGSHKVTVMQALAATSYNRVYLMFGVNETGWYSEDIFVADYKKIIDDIKTENPEAKIYIQSVLPVSKKVSETSDYVKNEKIARYNELLLQNVNYVNVAEAVSKDGVLPDDAAVDGIHLKKEYCEKWLEYLKVHTL